MRNKQKRRIKNFFIRSNFQGKIILTLFLAITVSCLFFVALLGFFSADTLTIAFENNNLPAGTTPLLLFKKALAANWIFLIICGAVLIIVTIIGTHRITGPLFRFENTLNNMVNKNLSDNLRLREKDEGKNLAYQINEFNSLLSRDLREVNRRSRAISDLTRQYEALKTANLSPEDIDSINTAIKVNNQKIRDLLNSYQLKDI